MPLRRLRQVEVNGVVLAGYGYDSQNRRARKTVGTKTTYYLYDLESRLLAEIAGSGRVLREYVWLGQEPLALREYELRPGLYYYINDHLGTPQRLITGEGTVVWQAAALPFGRTQVQLGTVQNNLRFPGQYYDAETGLHYNWNRYYDPETGRYLSPDPIGLDGGLNLYAYVDNDPVNWSDPEGLAAYKSVEGHLILGGGLLEIECCTEDGKGLKHLYGKICLGVAFEVSGGGGKAFNSDNKSCSNPAKNLLGSELGGSYVIGAEGSVTVDTGGGGVSGSGGLGVSGGKVGIGAKATSCYYRLINTIPSDQKCKCD